MVIIHDEIFFGAPSQGNFTPKVNDLVSSNCMRSGDERLEGCN